MANTEVTVLPKISALQHKFLQSYVETPIIYQVCEDLQIPLQTAYGWLKKKKVQANLQHYRAQIVEKCGITLEQVANEARRIAFYDIKQHIKAVKPGGSDQEGEFLVTYEDLDLIDGRAIKNIREKVVDGVSMAVIEPYEKDKFLRILADILKSQDPEKHLHLHLDPKDIEDKDIEGAARAYQDLIS